MSGDANGIVLSDETIEKIREALAPTHQRCFNPEELEALRDFARQIKEPKTRQAMINATEIWMDTTSTAKRWLVRLFLLGVAAMVFLGFIKAGVKIPK